MCRDSSVGIATGYGLDDLGIEFYDGPNGKWTPFLLDTALSATTWAFLIPNEGVGVRLDTNKQQTARGGWYISICIPSGDPADTSNGQRLWACCVTDSHILYCLCALQARGGGRCNVTTRNNLPAMHGCFWFVSIDDKGTWFIPMRWYMCLSRYCAVCDVVFAE
jgi:hypothetical protein